MKYITKMKRFIIKNKLIFFGFIISIIIIVAYVLSEDEKEWFSHAGESFNVISQFAIGFVINFGFYVLQVYLPSIAHNKTVEDCIVKKLNSITLNMREVFDKLGELYIPDYVSNMCLDEEQLLDMLKKLDFNNHVSKINPVKGIEYTTKELLLINMGFVEQEIEQLFSYYTPYISAELMDILDRILKSKMHTSMGRTNAQWPNSAIFKEANEDIFFNEYYGLMNELKKLADTYMV